MAEVHYFNPGPTMLPHEVLEQIAEDMFNWRGLGLSILEVSHLSQAFRELMQEVERDLRKVLQIPSHYRVLFLSGGSRIQYSMIPMNFFRKNQKADYINTGYWSNLAMESAVPYGDIFCVANTRESGYSKLPDSSTWQIRKNAAYFHYVANETIDGIAFQEIPECPSSVPMICDMTSCLLCYPWDIQNHGLIYASTQKVLGIAGLSVVIIREDLLDQALPTTPPAFHFANQLAHQCLYLTPPTFAIYVAGLMLKWIEHQGGVEKLAVVNRRKAKKMYEAVDSCPVYQPFVHPDFRSMVNVIFKLPTPELDQQFIDEAEKASLFGLRGHAVKGGIRISAYNAVPEESVDVLVEFMKDFAKKIG